MNPADLHEHSRLVRVAWESINDALNAIHRGDSMEFRRLLGHANLHSVEARAISDQLLSEARTRRDNPDS
jgi:hypothetical protein